MVIRTLVLNVLYLVNLRGSVTVVLLRGLEL
jgi:hypothetical protein